MTTPIVTLQDHEHAAQAALGDAAWAYFSGGAADEITLRHNVAAWQNLRLSPRVLQDLRGGHTRCSLMGRDWPMPLLVAPMAYQRWAHPEGESGMALAAAAQGCGMVLSHQTSTPLHDVAALVASDAERGPLWFQLYGLADRGAMRELLAQVEAAGFEALVLTVDAPVSGARDRERRAGFALPPGITAINLQGLRPPRASRGFTMPVLSRTALKGVISLARNFGVLALAMLVATTCWRTESHSACLEASSNNWMGFIHITPSIIDRSLGQ